MAIRKTVWQVVRDDSSMRSLRSTVASFETIGEAREFVKHGDDTASKEGWMIRTKPDVRSKKEKADAGDDF